LNGSGNKGRTHVAFAVWAFALGGPFAGFSWYQPIIAVTLMVAYTFLIRQVEA
jgi:hypothetical protein